MTTPLDLAVLRAAVEAATRAWEQIDAACSGLLARQCKRHAPYMGCAMDCGDVANALDPELLNARPLIVEALGAVPQLLAECERQRLALDRIQDELMAANLDVSTDDVPETFAHHVFVLRMALETRGENMDALSAERDRLRSLLAEACDIGEKHITNDNSALTDESLTRIAEIRSEGGIE